MLGERQRETFFFFLDVIARVVQELHSQSDLDALEEDMNIALALLERDFPMSKQV